MPLAKLRRFGERRRSVEDPFIYDSPWPEEVGRAAVARPGFDDSLRLQPDVGDWLIRLARLIRPLVQANGPPESRTGTPTWWTASGCTSSCSAPSRAGVAWHQPRTC
jgi:hypothetical protein